MYEYRASIRRVIDGDTVDVDIDLGFDVKLEDERVRIVGIDTPESRTSDPVEDLFGEAAKARVKELLDGDVVDRGNAKVVLHLHLQAVRGPCPLVTGRGRPFAGAATGPPAKTRDASAATLAPVDALALNSYTQAQDDPFTPHGVAPCPSIPPSRRSPSGSRRARARHGGSP